MSDLKRKTVKRDVGELVPKAKCPDCGQWADVDADQLAGDVSLVCPECGWHGYIDGRTA
jgi:predicted RNA-binding Zn-ribbon protein involved in translation (DUF1610 family)